MDKTTKKRLIVVLGMHRSGTSAITKSLELLGVGLGADLHPAAPDNPRGFWEDRDCLEINEKLLKHLGSKYSRLGFAWDEVPADSQVSALRVRATQLILRKLAENDGTWGFKDPRTCRLLAFWKEVFLALECEVSYVIAVRNPASVVASFSARDRSPAEKAYFLWLQHVLPTLSFVRSTRHVVVDFDEFLANPYSQIVRMSVNLGLPLPDRQNLLVRDFENKFLENGLRHARFTEAELALDGRASTIVAETYNLLLRLATDQESLESSSVQAKLDELNMRLRIASPAFDYINVLEDERVGLWQEVAERDGRLVNLNQEFTNEVHRLNLAVTDRDQALGVQASEIRRVHDILAQKDRDFQVQADEIRKHADEIRRLTASIGELNAGLIERERELANIKLSNWHQLGEALCEKGWTLDRLAKVAYHFTACITPQSWKPALHPWMELLERRYQRHTNPPAGVAPQAVRGHGKGTPGRPRVLHVIASFVVGGSSRLVADLIEGLGNAYEQKVVTSQLPSPPAYVGVDVIEFRSPRSPEDVLPFLREYAPAIVHVHYWGDINWWWYDIFFRAIQALGCRVIENVNTPVAPYKADFVDRYVHVSRYVEQHFGDGGPRNMTIYPGINFGLFSRTAGQQLASDCIGMVYRLEADKLNEQSIDVFIEVVRRRPRTRVIIVGGGTYLESYRQAARAAGVTQNFEFTGYVDYTTLPELYRKMSIFVAPVWKESFGQVSPFAMNLGIPVVGYKVGGLVEIVDDESLLAPPGDSDALADVIIGLLDDPACCQQIGDRNYARAQNFFSVEAMTGAYRTLYAQVMAAKE